jgi:GNAT superfamily N-acetyltransferase
LPLSERLEADFPSIRRFEAAGFRAWPASSVHYDGAWVIRLTPDHPAKRLNSVNPLDPRDVSGLENRIEEAARRFEACGKRLTFRLSPLSGQTIQQHFDRRGWSRFSESIVMRLPLSKGMLAGAVDQVPLKDVGRFTNAAMKVHGFDAAIRDGLHNVIVRLEPEAGLFVVERSDTPITTAICVHDRDLAGLFEIATASTERGKGFGRRIILSALKWAWLHGARMAWLQVEADNQAGRALYESLGFTEVYCYHYRQPPEV